MEDERRLSRVRLMLWAALLMIIGVRVLSSMGDEYPWQKAAAAIGPYPFIVAILAGRHRLSRAVALLAGVTGAYAIPFFLYGLQWDWMPWPLAAAVLCLFPRRYGSWMFGGLVVATGAIGFLAGDAYTVAIPRALKTADDGLILFGIFSLVCMVARLHGAREDLARLATLRERLRADGELRSVVGERLHTIREKLARARGSASDVAEAELGAAVDAARSALAGIRATAGEYRIVPVSQISSPIDSPKIARLSLFAFFLCEAVHQLINVASQDGRPWMFAVVASVEVAVGVLMLMPATRLRLVLLLVVLVVPVIPVSYFVPALGYIGNFWGFFLGLALVQMRPPRSWITAMLVLVTYAVVAACFPSPPPVPVQISGIVATLLIGWLTYSLARLSDLVVILRTAQEDLARIATSEERVRIARDLHDLLSFSLTAVALKGEVCRHLLRTDPDRARAEITDLASQVDQAIGELESVTRNRVGLRLAEEIEVAHGLLAAAGIDLTSHIDTGTLPPDVDTALAAVLREAVTNIIRHSNAVTCLIDITVIERGIRLRVLNDGVDPSRDTDVAGKTSGGSGLSGAAERTGGRLATRLLPGGRFELVAEFLPQTVPAPAPWSA